MDLLGFFVTVVLVTASGALAPGPLFLANLAEGVKGGARAGFAASLGHVVVEVPLVFTLALSLFQLNNPASLRLVGVVGGSAMILFGLLQVRDALSKIPVRSEQEAGRFSGAKRAFLIGVTLSALNPFFLIWWLTVGFGLVMEAIAFAALLGVVIMYLFHVWMDFAWLTGTAHLSAQGKTLLRSKGYAILLAGLGLALILIGFGFILRMAFGLRILWF